MESTEKKFKSLIERINSVRIKQKRTSLISGLLLFSAVAIILFVISAALETVFKFDSTGRIVITLLAIGIMSPLIILKLFKPTYFLFKRRFPADEQFAKSIGKHFLAIEDKLSNAIQVFKIKKTNPHGFSKDLIDASIKKIDQDVKEIDFKESVSNEPVWRNGKMFFGVVVVYLLFALGLGKNFWDAEYRLLRPFTEFRKPPEITIQVNPGNKQVLKNEAIEISAKVIGKKIKKLDLHLKEVNNEYHLTHSLEPTIENEFKFLIEHIQDTTEYFFTVGEIATEKYLLSVIELPLVRNFHVKITPPDYSRMSQQYLEENIGDINCLKGSYVEINLVSNKKLSRASLMLNNKKEVPLNINWESAIGGIRISEGGSYHIKLVDDEEFENKDPIEYRITLTEDIFPSVFITSPGQDVDLTENLILPLTIEAEDDFGFSSLRLGYKIIKMDNPFSDSLLKFISLPIDIKQQEKIVLDYFWDLTQLDIFAGDIISYYAEIFDNDAVSGPKKSKSKIN